MAYMHPDLTKSVTLTITEACNLSCSYCYEHHKYNRVMPIELAKTIIKNEMLKDDSSQYVYINLFGGEPFLEFQLIKEIKEYLEDSSFKKKYILFATTNGTLVHGFIKEWLLKNKNIFVCGLSLDGNKLMQDLNRSNSYDNIDLDFFLKHTLSRA